MPPGAIREGVRRLFRLAVRDRRRAAAEMDEELAFHVETRVAQFVARGMTPEAARAEALRRLGTTWTGARGALRRSTHRRERRMAFGEWLAGVRQDIGYAARGLRQRPLFTAVAVLTLAIGIGANTAIFSAVDALLLRPLPFRDPGALAVIGHLGPGSPDDPREDGLWSYRQYTLFHDLQRGFAATALHTDEERTLATDDGAERLVTEIVTGDYFRVLGSAPLLGRDFRAEDGVPGGPARTILSHALWSTRYGGDAGMLGRTLTIDGKPYEVIGVMPPAMRGLSGRAMLWLPVAAARDVESLSQPWDNSFAMIGRLRDGTTPAQAARDAGVAAGKVWEAVSAATTTLSSGGAGGWTATAWPLDRTRASTGMRRAVLVLFGAVGFLLLMASVNLATLLLGRAAARGDELAVRLAIGAGRGRLVRLLLTESLLLALLGGVASLAVAWSGAALLARLNPEETLRAQNLSALGIAGFGAIRLDGRALAVTFATTLLVGLGFGLFPALRATRRSLPVAARGGGRSGPPLGRARRALVTGQVALALVLLAGAGLMLRSLDRLMRVDAGFDATHLLTYRFIRSADGPRESVPPFFDDLLARLGAIPGVLSVGMADCPPVSGGCKGTIITFPDRPPPPQGKNDVIGVHFVSSGWHETMRVPLRRGRLFRADDRLGGPKVVLIGERAAARFWPGEDPIGKPVAIWQGGFQSGATVVGVVGDVRFGTIDSLPRPDAYLPLAQAPRAGGTIFLRTSTPPRQIVPAVRTLMRQVAPADPIDAIATMEDRVEVATAQPRFMAILLGLFAVVALALAVLGIYGVMVFAVMQRTREIGICMALGAEPRRILAAVVGEGARLVAVGAAIGLAAAFLLTRVLRTMLYEVTPGDPVTYLAIVAVILATTLLASWLPARRAARVAPTEALRRG